MLATVVNNTVDAIQTSKKIFVDTFVKHEGLAKSLNEFVDAQTNYTKQAIDASMKAGNEVYNTVFDRAFYTDTMKTMQESVQALYHTQKKKKEK
jgi:hypothetical protein